MHRCARCAKEIDASLVRCPFCGLDQYRPPPQAGLRGFADRIVPYGNDHYPWQPPDDQPPGAPSPWVSPFGFGASSPRTKAIGFGVAVAMAVALSFLLIVSIR